MAKQKMVVKLSLGDAKKRSKALQTAVTMDGIVSVTFDGDDKLVVVGEGTDSVAMTTLLRKKLGYADLISVGSAEEKKDEKKEGKKEDKPKDDNKIGHPFCYYPYNYAYAYPYAYISG